MAILLVVVVRGLAGTYSVLKCRITFPVDHFLRRNS